MISFLLMNSSNLEDTVVNEVYNYLAERKKATTIQIAKDLNLKVLTVTQVLIELKRRDKIKCIV